MIVVKTNGRTVVVTGWRAWLLGAAALIFLWLTFAFFAFIVIGAAITMGVLLLLLLPALVSVVLLGSLLRQKKP